LDVSLEKVKELRNKTGAGMLACKKALEESNGDFEKAIEYLRKQGAANVQKRIEKIAKEGLIIAKINGDRTAAAIAEVNCETDFVARSADFENFTKLVTDTVLKTKDASVASLFRESFNGMTIEQAFDDLSSKVGEKLEVKRAAYLKSQDGFFCVYNHVGNKVASVIELTGNVTDQGITLGNDLAMQVVAMKPIAIDRTGIDPSIIEKEKEIYRTQAKNEKKPENIVEKIAANKVEKYFQENCLIDQEFIKESGKSVNDIINAVSKETGINYKVKTMIRYQLGETL
jgi:elongation factor Ts